MTTTSSTAGGPFEERLRLTMLEALYSGKVREIYDSGPDHLLLVASDRISAFDVVFNEAVPDKGRVLTAMTVFWAEALAHVGETHLVSVNPADYPDGAAQIPGLLGRSMLVRRAEMLPIECIVRGYITGSAWKEYREAQTMHGAPLPAGLLESARLPEPVFTPSTKATEGHDENISFEQSAELVADDVAKRAREICLGACQALRPSWRSARHRDRGHQVRAGVRRRRADHLRRDPHPGLQPVLAGRLLGPRCHASVVRQAAGARLGRVDGVGQSVCAATGAG